MIKIFQTLSLGLCLLIGSIAYADEALVKNPEVQAFINDLVTHDHFDRSELEAIFKKVRPIPDVIHHMQHPAEGFPWDTYKNLFVTESRVNNGVGFTFRHKVLLDATEKKYHVPSEIIVAILGVESNYGAHPMKYLTIDALSHLAFYYPSRKTFFLAELKAYLELARQYQLNIDNIYGSYAGAIGPAQFMPDSVLRYAVITSKDLNLNDAANWIPSIANYFQKKGWHADEAIITPISCPKTIPDTITINSTKNFYSPETFKKYHLSDKAEHDAMLLEFPSQSGNQCWLAYHNFAVIMRYNTSPLYALAVTLLSQRLTSSGIDF